MTATAGSYNAAETVGLLRQMVREQAVLDERLANLDLQARLVDVFSLVGVAAGRFCRTLPDAVSYR